MLQPISWTEAGRPRATHILTMEQLRRLKCGEDEGDSAAHLVLGISMDVEMDTEGLLLSANPVCSVKAAARSCDRSSQARRTEFKSKMVTNVSR